MRRIIILIMVISVIFILGGCDQAKKTEAKKSIPVMIYETHPETIASFIKLTGGLEGSTDLDLYTMSSEKIKKLHVKEGDRVEAGALLLEQESEMMQQGVKLALAGVNAARAQLGLVSKEYSRMEKLLGEKAISQQQYDQAEMQQEAAKSGLELAEAQLQQAKQQLNYTKIFAPAAGEIAMLYFREGQMVPAGVPVIKLVNSKKVTARLQASEVDLQYLYPGQEVTAHFPAFAGEEFKGKVITIDSAVSPMTRTLEVEVLLENGSERLRSGLFGEFLLVTQARENVIVLSDAAIMTRTKLRIDNNGKQVADKEYYVFLAQNDKARMRTVKTGVHSLGRLEITEGLNMGEQVIVVGQNIVKDGDEVLIAN